MGNLVDVSSGDGRRWMTAADREQLESVVFPDDRLSQAILNKPGQIDVPSM